MHLPLHGIKTKRREEKSYPDYPMAIATAIAICPSPSPSHYSPALSSLQTTSSVKTLNHPPVFLLPPSSASGLASDAAVAAAAAEAVALASAAVKAARAAVWAAFEAGEEERGGCSVETVRRRRRKRRRGVEASGMVELHEVSFGTARPGVLAPKEEAEFCLCIKVLLPLCNLLVFPLLLGIQEQSRCKLFTNSVYANKMLVYCSVPSQIFCFSPLFCKLTGGRRAGGGQKEYCRNQRV